MSVVSPVRSVANIEFEIFHSLFLSLIPLLTRIIHKMIKMMTVCQRG